MDAAAVVIKHLQECWVDDQARHDGAFKTERDAPSTCYDALTTSSI
jgi:hypothetical protein